MSIPILNKNHTTQHSFPLSWMEDDYDEEGSTLSMQGSFLVINKAWEHNNNNNNNFDPRQEEYDHAGLVTTPRLMSSRSVSVSTSSSMDDDCSSSISSSSSDSDNDTMINISASSMRDSFLHVDLAASTANDSGRAQHHPYARWTHETQTGARQPRWSFTTTTAAAAAAALTRPLCGNNSTNNIGPYDLALLQEEDREAFQDGDVDVDDDDDDDQTVVDKDEQEQEQFEKQIPDKPLRRPSLLSALLLGGSHTVVNGSSPPVHLTCEENKEQQPQQQHHPALDYCKKNIINNNNDNLSSSLQYCVDWEQLQNAGPLFITTTLISQQPAEQMATSHSTLHYRLEPFQSGWW
ncbi:hypothetical protein O0I10_009937 [Lichtheimia ornata]|uniref:Uncharacterized protein n=1 Tax=Lichtheimia ornata TaxID=688661 RepID=A0AAD7UVL0_9FUNG|nr:uncharacterized protein O0I10_009937 [Lichtheimia ornata]KAJ8654369.1 hypothetical protein O0I10_009937 [Lichtheimia ornata]